MDTNLIAENLTNPALLFFVLGILAVRLKSDLEIPPNSSKFISLYLLFSIGFKGGQELAHSHFTLEILWSVVAGVAAAIIIPIYSFFMLKRKLTISDAGAIAATYGSVSAVTFITAVSFLDVQQIHYGGHMVAVMALMEAPAILIGVVLVRVFAKNEMAENKGIGGVISHAFTNGSVILILGSLFIGFLASDAQAQGIKPFTTDIFKGFLAIFLLDMGITSGRKLDGFLKNGWYTLGFAIVMPIVNGCLMAFLASMFIEEKGDVFMLAVLAASASYIAVPAAMKIAVPKANPGIYLPMALAITFPVNITLGLPLYLMMAQLCC